MANNCVSAPGEWNHCTNFANTTILMLATHNVIESVLLHRHRYCIPEDLGVSFYTARGYARYRWASRQKVVKTCFPSLVKQGCEIVCVGQLKWELPSNFPQGGEDWLLLRKSSLIKVSRSSKGLLISVVVRNLLASIYRPFVCHAV